MLAAGLILERLVILLAGVLTGLMVAGYLQTRRWLRSKELERAAAKTELEFSRSLVCLTCGGELAFDLGVYWCRSCQQTPADARQALSRGARLYELRGSRARRLATAAAATEARKR